MYWGQLAVYLLFGVHKQEPLLVHAELEVQLYALTKKPTIR